MVKAISGQAERTRPNSRLQQQSLLETTPILFRLPTVELQPYQPVDEKLASTIMRNYPATLATGSTVGLQAEGAPNSAAAHSEPTSETAESAAPNGRSWWEHWSSGVVMILLVVALVVLGIMISRSLGESASKSIASSTAESDFGDLDSITVPTTEITESPLIVGNPSDQDRQQVLASDLANAEVTPFESRSSVESPTNEQIPLMASLPTEIQLPNQQSSNDQLATATLMLPTPGLEPQQEYASLPAIPSLGEPNQPDGTLSTEAAKSAQPGVSQLGQSPSIYDEANSTYSMPNIAGDRPSVSPTTTQVSTLIPTQNNPPSNPPMRATATPDSNEEDIIRAYLELTNSFQSSPTSGSGSTNRYQRN